MKNSKTLVPIAIGVVTMLILIIGATYAYFVVNSNDEISSTDVSVNVEGISSASLESGTNLNIKLSAVDMAKQDEDIIYYASEDGTPQTTENTVTIATAKVADEGTYKCDYALNVAYSGDMKEAIPGAGSAILNINGIDYDIYLTSFPMTISGTMYGLNKNSSKTIEGSLRIINLNGTNQSDMAGTKMTFTFTATEFDCNPGGYAGEYILANATNGLNSELEGGMYRYQGLQTDSEGNTVNNYLCFGTTDKTECTSDEDSHMYRIMGITEDGRMKVLKKTTIGIYQWWPEKREDVRWYSSTGNSSLLYTALNGNDFLESETFIPGEWENYIEDTEWKSGFLENRNQSASAIYEIEEAWTEKVTAKIGLMYVSDYYYSHQSGGKICAPEQGSAVYSTCTNGWLHLSKNENDLPADASPIFYNGEWLMLRGTMTDEGYKTAFSIAQDGSVLQSSLHAQISIRPVFYLKKSIQFVSGTGAESDPYIITVSE